MTAGESTRSEPAQADDPRAPAPPKRPRDRLLRILAGPKAVLIVAASAAVTAVVGFYVPGLLSGISPGKPFLTNVLDTAMPPIRIVVPPARTAGSSPGASCDGFHAWGLGVGGVDAAETDFRLLVQGNTSDPLYIAGIRAHVLSRRPPASGVLAICPTQGFVTPQNIQLNLDVSDQGRYVTSAAHDSPFGFTVAKGETVAFDIAATTKRYDFRWVLEIDAVIKGQHHLFTVNDGGRPFETTAYDHRIKSFVWNLQDGWIAGGARSSQTIPAGHELVSPPGR